MKEKFRKVILMIGILITAAGLCLAMYATVSNWYCEYKAGNEIEIYSETVRNTSQDELRHIKENVIEYNHSLDIRRSKSSISYDEMLAATDAIGYLEIPRLQLMLPIYEGTEEECSGKRSWTHGADISSSGWGFYALCTCRTHRTSYSKAFYTSG